MTALQGGTPPEVYVVLCEQGEYDDWCMRVEGVFATPEAAAAHIRAQTVELCRTADGELVQTYMADIEDVVETLDAAPTEHPAGADGNGRRVGGRWHIDGDPRYDGEVYTVERWEVRA